MTSTDFIAAEALGEKLLASVLQMNAGLGEVVYSPVADVFAVSCVLPAKVPGGSEF